MSNWPEIELSSADSQTHMLAERLNVSPFLAQLLRNRQIQEDEARLMLTETPDLDWPEPTFIKELQHLFSAIHKQKKPVIIFGDYDADGLSGSSVLMTFLRGAGFHIETLLPTRSQGYGLNKKTLLSLIDQGYKLLITVDCGISNREEIAFARERGMQVVITDHHGLPEALPEAEFTLHPEVLKIDALANLSGAGMAYWLTCLLAPVFPDAPPPESLLDLAVIGTLADMTPLKGLNFALAKRGLAAARVTRRPGLLALGKLKDVDFSELTEDTLTFRMIPLLNAAGRIDSPMPALELLLAENETTAKSLAQKLEQLNTLRQQYCKDVLEDATQKLENHKGQVVVLADENWPHGVLGITCSQLVSNYHQPVVLLAIEGEQAKASIRAPKGYNVLAALQSCSDLLLRFGGHEMAGGLSIATEKIEVFAKAFEAACVQQQSHYAPKVSVDMELNPRMLKLELWEDMRKLAPFGVGNPAPILLSLKAPLKELHNDKKSGTHLFGRLNTRTRIRSWGQWDPEYLKHKHFNILYQLECNTWRGQRKLELNILHIAPLEQSNKTPSKPTTKNDVAKASPSRPSSVPVKTPAKQPAAISPPKASKKESTLSPYIVLEKTDDYCKGFFYAKNDWWQIPRVTYQEPTQWHDHRQHNSKQEYSVLYAETCPPEAVLKQAKPGAFSGLQLTGIPDQKNSLSLFKSFHDIYLMPAKAPAILPNFALLSRIVQHLGESQHNGVRSAHELAQRMHLDRNRAEICLRSLCDLGLLTYDRERYCLSYKNQAYDLRNSTFYQEEKARRLKRHRGHEKWCTYSFSRLKKALTQES